jgi:hypothetical protein
VGIETGDEASSRGATASNAKQFAKWWRAMVGREEEGGGDGSMMGTEERDGTEHIVLPHHSPR